jgi:ribosome-associated protein YbcJ (S4-like RNA binding protein)
MNQRRIDQAVTRLNARQQAKQADSLSLQLALPLWNEQQRGVPNGFLRSALFGAIPRGKRPHLKRELMASVEGISITYTGLRLCQDYLTLWECLVHVAREQQLGTRCEVTTYQLLKVLGKQDTGGNRKVLLDQLAVLQATAVEVSQGRQTYVGSLIEEAARDEDTGLVVIRLNQPLVALFQGNGYTRISWEIRRDLGRSLAQWLHGLYSSHQQPFPYTVAKIHELSGSTAKSLKSFEYETLVDALEELVVIYKKHGEHFAYVIDRRPSGQSLVRVSRDPAVQLPSQPPLIPS